jgi:N-acetylneuraminate synthase
MKIHNKNLGCDQPVYFIADIAANHDGDLNRAKDLIYLAAESGADAAKFQHFTAETIVSDYGFKKLGLQKSHQSSWGKSVFDVYKAATLNLDWTSELKDACDKANIAFFTSPYSFDLVDAIDPFVPAYKIGSGDITWIELIKHIAGKNKPYFIATGASTIEDVKKVVMEVSPINPNFCLMQCNTNYTANLENFKYINLNVLHTYRKLFPKTILGLSDHTPGHATVLGAVALGARVIEKHFTDNTYRTGPDHLFSMDPVSWKCMVKTCRELEAALGFYEKKVEFNEAETVILQRRSIRARKKLRLGEILIESDFVYLRPCPADGIAPWQYQDLINKKLKREIPEGDYIRWIDVE